MTKALGRVLVTGGAGYIGSHVVHTLLERSASVVVLDDLSAGTREAVAEGAILEVGDAGDRAFTAAVLDRHRCQAVLHFAGFIVNSESVRDPLAYYANIAGATRTLLEACVEAGVGTFVYSSSAAVYGAPERLPVNEDAALAPLAPYGRSKLAAEWMVRDAARAHGLDVAVLRYFNVAGADPAGRAGQSSRNVTHLIKIACQAALGLRDGIEIFGDDYDTPDGTCVRDYIHVSDLADAHLAALDHLGAGGESLTLNCGYGQGASVRDVLAAVERASGRKLDVRIGPRRPGDAPTLVADARRIREAFAWRPRYDELDAIVGSALAWERRLLEAAESS
ncbi:MAG: UDP-glucose 4-epimerase GalE [Rhodospirillales bacterium]|jgi:UDP-glucose 4-epimerase|nr:UDP-glucose 4-epimerase GalE [Rhodospirillales bacterium]